MLPVYLRLLHGSLQGKPQEHDLGEGSCSTKELQEAPLTVHSAGKERRPRSAARNLGEERLWGLALGCW